MEDNQSKASAEKLDALKAKAAATIPQLEGMRAELMHSHRKLMRIGIAIVALAAAAIAAAAVVLLFIPGYGHAVHEYHASSWCLLALCVAQNVFISAFRHKCRAVECDALVCRLDSLVLKMELNLVRGNDEEAGAVVEQ